MTELALHCRMNVSQTHRAINCQHLDDRALYHAIAKLSHH